MQKEKMGLKRIVQLQTQLDEIIKDFSDGKITPDEVDAKLQPLHKELDAG